MYLADLIADFVCIFGHSHSSVVTYIFAVYLLKALGGCNTRFWLHTRQRFVFVRNQKNCGIKSVTASSCSRALAEARLPTQ